MNEIYVYKSNGFYLGYVRNGYLFSRDGVYMGWIEENYVWDASGQFRGVLFDIDNHKYILRNRFQLAPVPRTPKATQLTGVPPTPAANIAPINLKVEYIDAF